MNPDFLVVGAGVAGLRAAIELAPAGKVLVVAKDTLRESSSEYAQGGIAAALNDDDEVSLHEQDTIAAGDGSRDVVIVPIGFISCHMEVLFDLDTQAKELADELGLHMERAHTAGVHPKFITMIRHLIEERVQGLTERPALGVLGASHDFCPLDCCPAPMVKW